MIHAFHWTTKGRQIAHSNYSWVTFIDPSPLRSFKQFTKLNIDILIHGSQFHGYFLLTNLIANIVWVMVTPVTYCDCPNSNPYRFLFLVGREFLVTLCFCTLCYAVSCETLKSPYPSICSGFDGSRIFRLMLSDHCWNIWNSYISEHHMSESCYSLWTLIIRRFHTKSATENIWIINDHVFIFGLLSPREYLQICHFVSMNNNDSSYGTWS